MKMNIRRLILTLFPMVLGLLLVKADQLDEERINSLVENVVNQKLGKAIKDILGMSIYLLLKKCTELQGYKHIKIVL